MSSISSCLGNTQASRPTQPTQPRSAGLSSRSGRHLMVVLALVATFLMTLLASWVIPAAQSAGILTNAISAHQAALATPNVICGAISLPC